MTEPAARDGLAREVVREVLEEVLPQMLASALEQRLEPAAAAAAPDSPPPAASQPVPQVPAPPLATVHRPSTWAVSEPSRQEDTLAASSQPAGLGDGQTVVEAVAIRTDADLEAFARRLLRLCESPRDRQSLRSGRLRFRLLRDGNAGEAVAAFRVERGAVTEKVIDEAAAAGTRVVLGPAAVLTPMGRDRARKLHVEIEREKRC